MAAQQDSIVIKFDSAQSYQEMITAVALADGYQEEIPDPDNPDGGMIPNPQSKDDFAVSRVAGFLTDKKQAVVNQTVTPPPVDSGIVT